MRGLCRASELKKVQKQVCGRRVSRSSFSEAQFVTDPELLREIYNSIGCELAKKRRSTGDVHRDKMQIVDSSLWYALPRMHWAVWRQQHGVQRAFRLHVKFHVLDGLPSDLAVRPARRCERLQWAEMLQPGEFYVGDRNYGEDYKLLNRLDTNGCFFIVRLRTNAQWVTLERLPINAAARAQNVISDSWVRLGKEGTGPRVRVIEILGQEEQVILATNFSVEQMSAEVVSLCYRQRWLVELFFRWLKHLMKANHLLAQSPEGVATQIYLTLIAAQIMFLFTGKPINKARYELLQWMMMGWATPAEVVSLLQKTK